MRRGELPSDLASKVAREWSSVLDDPEARRRMLQEAWEASGWPELQAALFNRELRRRLIAQARECTRGGGLGVSGGRRRR